MKLIYLASEGHQEPLVRLLHKLGMDCAPLDSRRWLEGQIEEFFSPVILVLPEKNLKVDAFVKAMMATPCVRYLVVFTAPLTAEISPILDVCGDCCQWPCDPLELIFRINRLSSGYRKPVERRKVNMESSVWKNLNLIGQSSIFLDTLALIKQASHCHAPVLIEGETGCGKEVTARAIHYLGCRRGFPFIAMNCGAVPDQLIENELFGHEKGAYTDAKQCQTGLTEQADGGTLFLDEIEALSIKGQITLLRFIEDNVVRPLGATKSRTVNVRVIAASNVCLSALVAQGQFRQDLLFRLNILYLILPPLRRRKSDIEPLADHFLQKYRNQYQQPEKHFHPDAVAWMNGHHWPGNVRELENFVHRAFLTSQDAEIIPDNIHQDQDEVQRCSRRKLFERRQDFKFDAPFTEAKNGAVQHFEQNYLTWLIKSVNGNVTQAADKAQKERRDLGKLLKKYAINPAYYRNS